MKSTLRRQLWRETNKQLLKANNMLNHKICSTRASLSSFLHVSQDGSASVLSHQQLHAFHFLNKVYSAAVESCNNFTQSNYHVFNPCLRSSATENVCYVWRRVSRSVYTEKNRRLYISRNLI